MTTITFRDGVIAGDTMMSHGDTPITMPGIKVFFAGQFAVGLSGDLRYMPLVKRWVEAGFPLDDHDFSRLWEDDWDCLVMNPDGQVFLPFADALYPITNQFFALGSGRDIALGALSMGASARQAVEIAARWDKHTNGIIESISVADLRKNLENDD